MILVGSGLTDDADDAAAGSAVLGRHRVGEDFEFLRGIDGEVGKSSRGVSDLVIGGPVDEEGIEDRLAAADVYRRCAPGRQNLSSEIADAADRRNQVRQTHRIAAVQGQVLYLAAVHDGAKRGGIWLEQESAAGDLDSVGHLTDSQRDRNRERAVRLHNHAVPAKGSETGVAGFKHIDAGLRQQELKVP